MTNINLLSIATLSEIWIEKSLDQNATELIVWQMTVVLFRSQYVKVQSIKLEFSYKKLSIGICEVVHHVFVYDANISTCPNLKWIMFLKQVPANVMHRQIM